jgi:hypothetical protein
MERRVIYQEIIQKVLEQHSKTKPSYGDIERFTAFDTQNDHYQMLSVGWEGCLTDKTRKLGDVCG